MTHTLYIIIIVITGLLSSIVTSAIPGIRERIRRNKAFKKQELNDLIERIVDEKLKQIIND